MTNGRFSTCAVAGLYWISCIRSFSNTTLPGVVATFSPSLKAFSSVIEICNCPPPFSMSARRLFRPRTRFTDMEVTRAGSLASFAYRSMYALAIPISSRIAAESDSACFWVKSARIFDERSATDCTTLGSTCSIAHDAIGAVGALQAPGVVEVMQMGYRFAHGEERLVRVERPAEQQPQQLAGAALFIFQRIFYFC